MKNSKQIVNLVRDTAKVLGGEFNLTHSGVPRIIMTGYDIKISLVYVARSNIWKAFYPYPSAIQKRKYFEDYIDLIKFLQDKGCSLPENLQSLLDHKIVG